MVLYIFSRSNKASYLHFADIVTILTSLGSKLVSKKSSLIYFFIFINIIKVSLNIFFFQYFFKYKNKKKYI